MGIVAPADAYEARTGELIADGATAGKFDPFGAYPGPDRQLPTSTLNEVREMIRGIRQAGPDFDICVEGHGGGDRLATDAGPNRFVWDLSYPGVEGEVVQRAGPVDAVPGTYHVRLTGGDWTRTASFEVLKDPRISTTPADFLAQFELLSDIRDRHQHVNGAGGEEIRERADALVERLTDVEAQIILVPRGPVMGHQPRMVNRQLSFLASYVGSADARPTDGDLERFQELVGWLDDRTQDVCSVLQQDLTDFNNLIGRQGVGPILVRLPSLRRITEPGPP